jgi:hypothetical protein
VVSQNPGALDAESLRLSAQLPIRVGFPEKSDFRDSQFPDGWTEAPIGELLLPKLRSSLPTRQTWWSSCGVIWMTSTVLWSANSLRATSFARTKTTETLALHWGQKANIGFSSDQRSAGKIHISQCRIPRRVVQFPDSRPKALFRYRVYRPSGLLLRLGNNRRGSGVLTLPVCLHGQTKCESRFKASFRFSHGREEYSALAESIQNKTSKVAAFIAGEMKDQRCSIQIEFVG